MPQMPQYRIFFSYGSEDRFIVTEFLLPRLKGSGAANAIGGALWVGVWVLGSFYLTEHRSLIEQVAQDIGIFGSLLVVLAIALAVLVKRMRTGLWV
jgi:hypothetical protein